MVVPAFGFSAGDFIAAVGVLKKTARALRDTEGAASQHQHAVLKLRSMRSALIRLQSLVPKTEDASIVEEIRKCSKACIISLDKFLNTIEKLDRELGRRERGWRKTCAQAKWALKFEPELRRLEASLDAEVQPLQILLQLDARDNRSSLDKVTLETRDLARHTSNIFEDYVSHFSDMAVPMAAQLDKLSSDLPDFKDELSTTMRRIQGGMENLQTTQKDLQQSLSCAKSSTPNSIEISSTSVQFQGNLPRHGSILVICGQKLERIDAALLYLVLDALGEEIIRLAIILICLMPAVQRLLSKSCSSFVRAPTWLLDNDIRLEDCLGRTVNLPFEHFRHWSLVYAKLEVVLRETPGEDMMKTGRFQVFGHGSLLSKDNWDAMVFPGAQVVMSVEFDISRLRRVCPCCANRMSQDKQGWKCLRPMHVQMPCDQHPTIDEAQPRSGEKKSGRRHRDWCYTTRFLTIWIPHVQESSLCGEIANPEFRGRWTRGT